MIPAMPMNFKNPTDPHDLGTPRNPEPGTVWAGIGRISFPYILQITARHGELDADPRVWKL